MDVRDLGARIRSRDRVSNGLHQVRLADADPAIDEQRVVSAAGIACDLHSGGARELIALAFDEAIEREGWVEPAAEHRARDANLCLDGWRRRVALHRRARA